MGCPLLLGLGRRKREAPTMPWPERPSGLVQNSAEAEPEDFWEVTFEETRIVAVRIHMLSRNRDFQPDPAAMPPGVNINMLEDRRLNHVVFVDQARGRRTFVDNWRQDIFREARAWTGSTTFWLPLRGTVSLADLGIDENPGSRDRSRSPRDDNDPRNTGPARPRSREEPSSSQGERQVRPRLRALRWMKKEFEEEVIRVEQETKPNPQKEVDKDQTIHEAPWELEKYKVVPQSKSKDQWDWSVPGWAIRAHGKPRKRRFHPIHRDFPVDAVDLESTRTTVKLFAGESRLGLTRIEEDSWTAPQARQATSKLQQWRGYTFFRIKEKDEKPSSGTQRRHRLRRLGRGLGRWGTSRVAQWSEELRRAR